MPQWRVVDAIEREQQVSDDRQIPTVPGKFYGALCKAGDLAR